MGWRICRLLLICCVLQLASSAPLQWEQIRPVGPGPDARDSYVTCSFDSAQGLTYLYGGRNLSGKVLGDVWLYDAAAMGWSEVEFETSMHFCPASAPNLQAPEPRASAALVNTGSTGLMCGGYTVEGSTDAEGSILEPIGRDENSSQIDCWWLTPLPAPRWDRLLLDPDSPVPEARYSHTLTYTGSPLRSVILFGGTTTSGTPDNSCWILVLNKLSAEAPASETYASSYSWASCDPIVAAADLRPYARFGHVAVWFKTSLYIQGGFASNSVRVQAIDDVWSLHLFQSEDDSTQTLLPRREWEQVMARSSAPQPRGYHAAWISGFTMYIHGGQGPSGVGVAAVLGDTWQFDLFTLNWQLYESSDASPVASHLSITPREGAVGVCFGGRAQNGQPSGKLYVFNSVSGWQRVLPAGARPSRRVGHVAIYQEGAQQLIVSFGWDTKALHDTWIFDVSTRQWSCLHGYDPACQSTPLLPPMGPPPMGFPANQVAGLYNFVFGGMVTTDMPCPNPDQGLIPIGYGTNDTWAMNLVTFEWSKVDPPSSVRPSPRAMAGMVLAGEQDGLKQPLVVVGGVDMACSYLPTPCPHPLPLGDFWVMDVSPFEAGDSTNQMAELDGVDDIVQIDLPTWCDDVNAMSVLWLDFWSFVSAQAGSKTILVDAYSGTTPVLRWYLASVDQKNYLKLLLLPGKNQQLVKTWGPFGNDLLGLWHHTAITLRFARNSPCGGRYSRISSNPEVVITQAFLFLDGVAVPESTNAFASLNLHRDLSFSTGLSSIFFGGPNPASSVSNGYDNFAGFVDNLRIWWPSCPHANDPSRCNPYAFLYPVLADGSRLPDASIQDSDVRLTDVAPPINDYMFVDTPPADTDGLLVSLTFDKVAAGGYAHDDSTWEGPSDCVPADADPFLAMQGEYGQLDAYCSGCEPSCVFGNCPAFDTECVESGLQSPDDLVAYGEVGLCQCNNIEDCPSNVQACMCPGSLYRVCSMCGAQICADTGDMCEGNSDCTTGGCRNLDPVFCPDEFCVAWTCACAGQGGANGSLAGVFSMVPSHVDEEWTCACADGLEETAMPDDHGMYACCTELDGVGCLEWNEDYSVCLAVVDGPHDPCGVSSCCQTANAGPPGMDHGGEVVDPGQEQAEDGCTLEINGNGVFVGNFIENTPAMRSAAGAEHDQTSLLRRAREELDSGRGQVVLPNTLFVGRFVPLVSTEEAAEQTKTSAASARQREGAALRQDKTAQREGPGKGASEQSSAKDVQKSRQPRRREQVAYREDERSKRADEAERARAERRRGKTGKKSSDAASTEQGAGLKTKTKPTLSSSTGKTGVADSEPVRLRRGGMRSLLQNATNETSPEAYVESEIVLWSLTDYSLNALITNAISSVIQQVSGARPGQVTVSAMPNMEYYFRVDADNTTQLDSFFTALDANLLTQLSHPAMDWSQVGPPPNGLKDNAPGAPAPEAIWVNDDPHTGGLQKLFCGDGSVAARSEDCDSGEALNGDMFACDAECRCNPGFEAIDGICECTSMVSARAYVEESTRMQGATNSITLSVGFDSSVQGLNGQDRLLSPTVVTISGLTGTQTPSDSAFALEACEGPPSWSGECGIGLQPVSSASGTWRRSVVDWNQETGTLKFTVLSDVNPAGIGTQFETSSTVRLTLSLVNRAVTQPAVSPTIQICQEPAEVFAGYVLASSQVELAAGGSLQVRKVTGDDDDSTSLVATATLSEGSVPSGGKVVVEALEADVERDISMLQDRKLPVQAQFAGLQGTAMRFTIYDADNAVVPLSGSNSSVRIQIDTAILRSQGGCYEDDDDTVKICIPGYAGLYEYDSNLEEWVLRSGKDFASREAQSLSAELSGSGFFAVMATAPCYDYGGQGKAGGDRVCSMTPAAVSTPSTPGLLGGGTISKFPSVSRTTRPDMSSQAELQTYLSGDSTGAARVYQTRTGWVEMTPKTGLQLPPRFGHSIAVVGGTRILIYGGTECMSFDNVTGFCEGYAPPSNDLFEFDTLKATSGLDALRQILLSPVLSGKNAQAMVALAGEDHRVLVFGGNANWFFLHESTGATKPTTDESFEVRDLSFRSRKAGSEPVSGTGSLSAMAVASNATHVMLFGGFINNALSSALWTYSLSAASASLGLEPMPAYSVGPDSRSYPGLIKPDDNTLILYGGVNSNSGLGDLWRLDINTQYWEKLHAELQATPSAAFSAFSQIAETTAGSGTTIIRAGGIQGGYVSGVTFMQGGDINDVDNQPTATAYAWNSMSMSEGQDATAWLKTRASEQELQGGALGCCVYADTCPLAFQGRGCDLPATASTSMEFGYFASGLASFVLYGGLNRYGEAMAEFWYIDVSSDEMGLMMNLTVAGVDYEQFNAEEFVGVLESSFSCPETAALYEASVHRSPFSTPSNPLVVVRFVLTEAEIVPCVLTHAYNSSYLDAVLAGTPMATARIPIPANDAWVFESYEVRLSSRQFRTSEECKYDCVRGICQADYAIDSDTPTSTSLLDDEGEIKYCFSNADLLADDTSCYVEGAYAGYSCSLPGPLHGHQSAQVMLGGQSQILLLLGGERTGFWSDLSELSMDVHGGAFASGIMTMTKLWTTDDQGVDCGQTDSAGDVAMCPEVRRDMAVAIMGNTGGSNGKLLMFGGMGMGTAAISPFRSFLEKGQVDLQAYNDLWFLDMADLTEDCIKLSECEPLAWHQVDVLGNKPLGRWGAGLMLDTSDNLYIMGGTNYDTTAKAYAELDDLYIFQLRDPFYKYCSATGVGLQSAIAGVPAYFLIQCRDAFGEMASGATFRVEVVGLDSQPGLTPSPYAVGTGLYRCDYTAIVRGSYEIRIYVGRGGSQYQDLISGIDTELSNDDHDFYYGEHTSTAARVFSLTVSPGATDPANSRVTTTGGELTTTTAGVITSFTVTAMDSFSNRRPGGEVINALMELWDVPKNAIADPALTPETAAITDNKDGRYSASYRITRSGVYQLSISLSGVQGAGSPYQLMVASAEADIARTYVFGPFEQVVTGKTTTIFVQTRDQFGNNMRVDPTVKPAGVEQIGFELCITKGSLAANYTCAGGQEEPNVGVTITYAFGPDGQQKNSATGEYYFGLYKIDFYPFEAGSYTPQVKHNDTYVSCYFDSTAAPTASEQRPSVTSADECADQQSSTSSARRRQTHLWTAEPQMRVRAQSEESEALHVRARRADKQVVWETQNMEITQVFQTPDTSNERLWIALAPALCVLMAVVIEASCFAHKLYREKEERNMNRIADANNDKIRASIDGDYQPVHGGVSSVPSTAAVRETSSLHSAAGSTREHDPTLRALNALVEMGVLSGLTLDEAMRKAEAGDAAVLAVLDKHRNMLSQTAQEMEAVLLSSRAAQIPLQNAPMASIDEDAAAGTEVQRESVVSDTGSLRTEMLTNQ